MGLIRLAIDSVKGTLQDQHQTAIVCEDMGNEILMMRKTKQNGIIRDGSAVVVNPGQLAVLVDNGRVVDAVAEQGVFEFQSDASPSFFAGSFGGMFREMWTRFAFGGGTWQDQAVYFVNVKEIIDNGFGTPAPVMYRDWEHQMSDARSPGGRVPMRVAIKCMGNYTFEIHEPALFMQKIGGTIPIYQKDELCGQMRVEIVSVFQAVLNSLCNEQNQVFPLDLPAQSFFVKELMERQVFDKAIRQRGIRIAGFNILKVDLDDDSKQKIDEYERSGDFSTQEARKITGLQMAASNEGGAGVGFFNIGMMNQASGSGIFGAPQEHPSAPTASTAHPQPGGQAVVGAAQEGRGDESTLPGAVCGNCHAVLIGPFCAQCGTAAPKPAERFCSQCGAKAGGPFCAQCGAKLS